uniref:Uncharacterized protein n=1 Tax=Streptomyces auratus AGR0001 TaxID=1160718 RepID=J2A332_9ACTN
MGSARPDNIDGQTCSARSSCRQIADLVPGFTQWPRNVPADRIGIELRELFPDPARLGVSGGIDGVMRVIDSTCDIADEDMAFGETDPVERVTSVCLWAALVERHTDFLRCRMRMLMRVPPSKFQ